MTVLIDAKHLDNAVRRSRNVANDPKTIKDYNVLVERMEQYATEWNALYQLQMQNNWDEVDAEKFDNLRQELNENVDGGLLTIKESRRSYADTLPKEQEKPQSFDTFINDILTHTSKDIVDSVFRHHQSPDVTVKGPPTGPFQRAARRRDGNASSEMEDAITPSDIATTYAKLILDLEERFGGSERLLNDLSKEVTKHPRILYGDIDTLATLIAATFRYQKAQVELGDNSDGRMLFREVYNKLPRQYRLDYGRWVSNNIPQSKRSPMMSKQIDDLMTTSNLLEWMETQLRLLRREATIFDIDLDVQDKRKPNVKPTIRGAKTFLATIPSEPEEPSENESKPYLMIRNPGKEGRDTAGDATRRGLRLRHGPQLQRDRGRSQMPHLQGRTLATKMSKVP
ncbi:unnamed protein product [Sphagnum tenellum]